MKDQHIIPEAYLKGFYNKNNHFFSLDTNLYSLGKLPSAKKKTAGMVCYKPHYYTLDITFKQQYPAYEGFDPYFLEKKFHSYEQKFKKIIELFQNRSLVINVNDASMLLYALFDFKVRNNYFRQNIVSRSYPEVIKKLLNETLDPPFNLSEDLTAFKISIENYKNELFNKLNSADSIRATHIVSLIMPDSLHDRVVSTLLYHEWAVFTSDHGFFTSDNPGFCLDSADVVHNTKFSEDFFFIFPLTDCCCLVIKDEKIDLKYYEDMNYKNIIYRPAPDDIVKRINNMILKNVNQFIFSSDEDKLNKFSTTISYTKV
ncbi:MAG: DUF4238 domain-containing protein [Mucilaginibacter sp.]|nr:DUF4238 domain-containing protein [Mucilaginibacter sp.]